MKFLKNLSKSWFLIFSKQKRHIKRQSQDLSAAAYVVLAEFKDITAYANFFHSFMIFDACCRPFVLMRITYTPEGIFSKEKTSE